jgi:nucleoside triphosphate pyrophosphatase
MATDVAARQSPLPLVLASASPRRLALLAQAGIVPARIVAPDVDETSKKNELPRAYALRIALAKAETVVRAEDAALVLAADTVVAVGRRILPKAETADEVAHCLKMLSGRRHLVTTALALAAPGTPIRTRIVTTRVAFKVLSACEIAGYAASDEGIGKAGGYAIQGRAEALVRFINGSYSNVVGLPLYETTSMLEGRGYRAG